MNSRHENKHIIIFDGVCNFCNRSVNFIIKRDPQAVFHFTPMQSTTAKSLLEKHQIYNADLDTFLLIKNNSYYSFTDAALEITRDLSGYWRFLYILRIIPAPIRDFFYRLFARNRYQLFGKSDSCMVPTDELKSRFLD